jgi:hypothetical protein
MSDELLTDHDKEIALYRAVLFELASELGMDAVSSESPYTFSKRAIKELRTDAERYRLLRKVAVLEGFSASEEEFDKTCEGKCNEALSLYETSR